MKTQGNGSASGKIILMGEHSVVFGQPAIAMPLEAVRVRVQVERLAPNMADQLDSGYFRGELADAPDTLENIKVLVRRLKDFFYLQGGLALQIISQIPAERGMGSSAAVAVALTRSFFDLADQPLDPALLLEFANISERVAHGNPSGIDAAAASGRYPLYFRKGSPIEAFDSNLSGWLTIADTGIRGKTRQAVADVGKLVKEAPQARAMIFSLGLLTQIARFALEKNQLDILGQTMNDAQALLKKLTVSSAELDQLISSALQAGAIGAKLTGGGRGGCMLALSRTEEAAAEIGRQLKITGARAIWFQKLGE